MPRDNLRILTGQPVRDLVGAEDTPERIVGVVLQDGHRFSAKKILLAAG